METNFKVMENFFLDSLCDDNNVTNPTVLFTEYPVSSFPSDNYIDQPGEEYYHNNNTNNNNHNNFHEKYYFVNNQSCSNNYNDNNNNDNNTIHPVCNQIPTIEPKEKPSKECCEQTNAIVENETEENLEKIRKEVHSYSKKKAILEKMSVIKKYFPDTISFHPNRENPSKICFDERKVRSLRIYADHRWISRGLNTVGFKRSKENIDNLTVYVRDSTQPICQKKRKISQPQTKQQIKKTKTETDKSLVPAETRTTITDASQPLNMLMVPLKYYLDRLAKSNDYQVKRSMSKIIEGLENSIASFLDLERTLQRAISTSWGEVIAQRSLRKRIELSGICGKVVVRRYQGCKGFCVSRFAHDFQNLMSKRNLPVMYYYWRSDDESGFLESYTVLQNSESAILACQLAHSYIYNKDRINRFGSIANLLKLQEISFAC